MSRICGYTGQIRKMRKFATEKLGSDKVVEMCDQDIDEWADDNYTIFWADTEDVLYHAPDPEIFVLIPNNAFHELLERGDIVFIER